ncbi:hypothetical protein COCCADRAFT_98619, partial [Bipolaris zeicola 26-R-13]
CNTLCMHFAKLHPCGKRSILLGDLRRATGAGRSSDGFGFFELPCRGNIS